MTMKVLLSKKYLISGIIVAVVLIATSLIIPFAVFEVHKNKLTDHDPIVIWGDEDFEVYNFPGKGTQSNPYKIENYNITTNLQVGIYIWNTTKYFVIRDCYVNANVTGIYIDSITEETGTINRNEVEMNEKHGILVYGSVAVAITENTCNLNKFGIYVHSSSSTNLIENLCTNNVYGIITLYSSSFIISENQVAYNQVGIYTLFSSSLSLSQNFISYSHYGIYLHESSTIALNSNECSYNHYGIYLNGTSTSSVDDNEFSYGYYGMYVYYASFSSFHNNRITSNNLGIYMVSGTNYSSISFNLFENIGGYAIYIHAFNFGNVIHHNSFVNTTYGGTSQAYDDGVNTWYDTYINEGNYWDSYGGTGVYSIDGIAGSYDPYPLENRPV